MFFEVCLKISLKPFFPTLFACLWIMFYVFCFDNVWKRHVKILLKLLMEICHFLFLFLFFIRNKFVVDGNSWKIFSQIFFSLNFWKSKSLKHLIYYLGNFDFFFVLKKWGKVGKKYLKIMEIESKKSHQTPIPKALDYNSIIPFNP